MVNLVEYLMTMAVILFAEIGAGVVIFSVIDHYFDRKRNDLLHFAKNLEEFSKFFAAKKDS